MKITDLLEEKSIRLNAAASSKKEALNQIINLISQTGNITNKEEYKEIVFKREEQGTTGIGEGIGIWASIQWKIMAKAINIDNVVICFVVFIPSPQILYTNKKET